MATLESIGLGSGVLSSDLIEKIINAEREPVEKRLDVRQELNEAKITAYGEIKSQMEKMRIAAVTLSSPTLTGATKVKSSSDSILTATGSSAARPGKYNVEVLNTAKAHSVATGTYSSIDAPIGEGVLKFNFGSLTYDANGAITGQDQDSKLPSKAIKIDSTNNTLAGLRDTINQYDIGVTASIVNDGNGYRLQLVSSETGEENAFTIEALDTDDNPLGAGDALADFNFNATSQGALTETSRAEDAELKVNGLTIKRASNDVEGVIDGVTLHLNSADVGKNVVVEVEPDLEGLTKTIQEFVDAYNGLKEFVDDLSKFDEKTNTGGLLMGDPTIRNMMAQVRNLFSEPIVGIGGKYHALVDLGVETNRNNKFLLDFDASKLEKAIKDDRSSVVGLLSKTGTTSDVHIKYMNDSVNTKPGEYEVVITQEAAKAKYLTNALGHDFSQGPLTIQPEDSAAVPPVVGNDFFTLNLNGKNVGIELSAGDYASGEELAAEIQKQINQNVTLGEAGANAAVSYDSATNQLEFVSNIYGSASSISFAATDTDTMDLFGFRAGEVSVGKDVAGTIDGVEAKGEGLYLRAQSGVSEATNGYFIGNEATAVDSSNPVTIDASNNTFKVKIDGVEAEVTIANGTYNDHDALKQALQQALDSNSTLSGQKILAKVEFTTGTGTDLDNRFSIISGTTGAKSRVEITDTGSGNLADIFGFVMGKGDGQEGKDTQGTPSGADGIRLQVSPDGTIGPRGTVSQISGFGDRLKDLMNSFLKDRGNIMGSKEKSFDREQASIKEEREKLKDRMEKQENRLKASFMYNDALVARLNSTLDFVKGQFEAMNAQKK